MKQIMELFTKNKFLGETVGFIVFVLAFATYFPVFLAWFFTHVVLWGFHAMFFGDSNLSEAGKRWAVIPASVPIAVLVIGALVWTFLILRALFS